MSSRPTFERSLQIEHAKATQRLVRMEDGRWYRQRIDKSHHWCQGCDRVYEQCWMKWTDSGMFWCLTCGGGPSVPAMWDDYRPDQKFLMVGGG